MSLSFWPRTCFWSRYNPSQGSLRARTLCCDIGMVASARYRVEIVRSSIFVRRNSTNRWDREILSPSRLVAYQQLTDPTIITVDLAHLHSREMPLTSRNRRRCQPLATDQPQCNVFFIKPATPMKLSDPAKRLYRRETETSTRCRRGAIEDSFRLSERLLQDVCAHDQVACHFDTFDSPSPCSPQELQYFIQHS